MSPTSLKYQLNHCFFRVIKKRARFSSIYNPNSPPGRRATLLALFSSDEVPRSTLLKYPTATQDSQARKVSLVEIVEEGTPPPNRLGLLGKYIAQFC